MEIVVFRYGHRLERDKRTTTHCALVARALGAKEIIYTGEEDPSVEESVLDINKNWGSNFKISFVKNWMNKLEGLKRTHTLIHLTMYGLDFTDFVKQIEKKKDKLKKIVVIVGSQKVPSDVYQIADYNVSITNQPHSEIAALTLMLNQLNPKAITKSFQKKNFTNARIAITPANKGKIVTEL